MLPKSQDLEDTANRHYYSDSHQAEEQMDEIAGLYLPP